MNITFRPLDHVAEPPPPDKIYTPAKMVELAQGLEEAIAKIEEWDIEVKMGSPGVWLPGTAYVPGR